ncbi:MAG: hypothetical protein PV344_04665, partial [Anaplasma sp.]|nr:hypothetical protein [Anaplasma sp.]
MLTCCPNCSRDLFFANRTRFAKFAKIRSSQKFSRLQYLFLSICQYKFNRYYGDFLFKLPSGQHLKKNLV